MFLLNSIIKPESQTDVENCSLRIKFISLTVFETNELSLAPNNSFAVQNLCSFLNITIYTHKKYLH